MRRFYLFHNLLFNKESRRGKNVVNVLFVTIIKVTFTNLCTIIEKVIKHMIIIIGISNCWSSKLSERNEITSAYKVLNIFMRDVQSLIKV